MPTEWTFEDESHWWEVDLEQWKVDPSEAFEKGIDVNFRIREEIGPVYINPSIHGMHVDDISESSPESGSDESDDPSNWDPIGEYYDGDDWVRMEPADGMHGIEPGVWQFEEESVLELDVSEGTDMVTVDARNGDLHLTLPVCESGRILVLKRADDSPNRLTISSGDGPVCLPPGYWCNMVSDGKRFHLV